MANWWWPNELIYVGSLLHTAEKVSRPSTPFSEFNTCTFCKPAVTVCIYQSFYLDISLFYWNIKLPGFRLPLFSFGNVDNFMYSYDISIAMGWVTGSWTTLLSLLESVGLILNCGYGTINVFVCGIRYSVDWEGHCWKLIATRFSMLSHGSGGNVVIDLLHKAHDAPDPFHTTHHFATEVCTFLLQNVALRDVCLMN